MYVGEPAGGRKTNKPKLNMKKLASTPTPKFSPKPVKRPIKIVLSTSDSPSPETPRGPVRK
jgi:hypothetical protein